jgi:hypothetical protein
LKRNPELKQTHTARILVVDDQIHALQGVSRIIRAAGHAILAAGRNPYKGKEVALKTTMIYVNDLVKSYQRKDDKRKCTTMIPYV